MNILFVNPPFKSEYGKFSREARSPMITNSGVIYYPLWLLYAAGVCEKAGFDITFVDAPAKKMDDNETISKIKCYQKNYSLIVVDTSTPSIYSDVEFAARLKKEYPKSKIILVGTHPTALPEETLKLNSKVDFIANGEFDYIVRDLALAIKNKKPISDVNGLIYMKNGKIVYNPKAELITDLDNIPFASELIKKYLDINDYFFAAAEFPEIQIFTGRGCPARCYFCVYPQIIHGHIYRTRSVENVVAEFEYIINNLPSVKEVVIEDDTFTIDKKRVVEICNLLIEKGINKKIKWLCNARVNLDLETMKIMKKAGCRLIIPGIENGTQEMLNNMKKGTTLKQINEYVKNAKKTGLLVHACYMVGNRGETKETMNETLKLALKLNTDTAQFYTLHVYPGTEAFNWAKENNRLDTLDFSKWVKEDGSDNTVIHTEDMSSDELVEFCDNARKKYYLRPRYVIMKLLQSVKHPREFARNVKGFKILLLSYSKKGTRMGKVSVVLASYNGEKYIKEQIESILVNLRESDELIISDDGSSDNTINIIKNIKDDRIKLIDGPHKGIVKNFENAIKNASGDYIFLSDQDDIWMKNKVSTILPYFDEYILVQHDAVVVDGDNNIIYPSFAKHRKVKRGIIKNLIKNSYHGCCIAFRKELIKQIIPFPNVYLHDQWIGLIAEKNGKTIFIDNKLIKYRRYEGNNSSFTHLPFGKQVKNRIGYIKALLKYKKR